MGRRIGPHNDSSQCDDSNAIIMSSIRKNTKQGRKQKSRHIVTQRIPTLSKSQKRKLGKLEEKKEKSVLLKKIYENLEKYKIPEEVYPLLQSSSSIGQRETKRQKRRKAVQYLKTGIRVPSNYHNINIKGVNNSAISKINTDFDQGREKQVYDDGIESMQLAMKDKVLDDLSINHVSDAVIPVKDDSTFNNAMPVHETSCINDENIVKPSIEAKKNEVGISCPINNLSRVPIVVHASRPKHIDDQRRDLPIFMMEQEIMEAINEHLTVIICGETGCGKTTQVPQFLYEAGYGSNQSITRSGIIGVTQPRRVAVLATAKRVAFELGFRLGKEVGFQVRHDKKIGHNCCIKFMTDGILLREVQTDFLLRHYSVIILDEAHERSLNTDILIGMLSRVIKIREKLFVEQQRKKILGENIGPENMIFPLKIVLMSATLRVDDFVSGKKIFCSPPPVIEVPARQFPVTTHFSKKTEIVDYIGQAYKKVLSIHKSLPPGGILVFVTGQREVEYLCQKLRRASRGFILRNCGAKKIGINETFNPNMEGDAMNEINEAFDINGISDDQKADRFNSYEEDHGDPTEDELDAFYDSQSMTESETEDEGDSDTLVLGEAGRLSSLKAAFEALAGNSDQVTNATSECEPKEVDPSFMKVNNSRRNGVDVGALCVLPLYAMLPAAAQLRVFEEIKEGERLVVVATNVAETSLTIPGIKYVVDTGREKVKNYNPCNGMESYEVQWISKASASQRTGRAGRIAPGHCYRLYSSAAFNNVFPDFSVPEISKIPVDGVVLLMKSMGIDKVANFPFPTPPLNEALVEAECCLKTLQALDVNGRLTSLGKAMAQFPMSPRHSRMLLTTIKITKQVKNRVRPDLVLGYAFAAAAALSFSSPFLIQFDGDRSNMEAEKKKITDAQENPNAIKKSWKKKLKETAKASRVKFSNPNSDALSVAYALQCFDLSANPSEFCDEYALHLKTMDEMSKLRKQLLGLLFNVRNSNGEFSWNHGTFEDVEFSWQSNNDQKYPLLLDEEEIICQSICAGWADRVAKRFRQIPGYETSSSVNESVFLHRWSSLSNSAPEFLVYNQLLHTKRTYIHGATSVKPDWLVKYAASLCTFSAPVSDPKPYYEPFQDELFYWVFPTFGPRLWNLPLHSLPICKPAIRVQVFAYALLGGHVLPCLNLVRKFMAAAPGLVLRPEAFGQRRVGNLLNRLKSRVRSIDSCARLKEAWAEDPMELYSEILDWFQQSFHPQFEEVWEMMHSEIVLEPQERFAKKEKIKEIKL